VAHTSRSFIKRNEVVTLRRERFDVRKPGSGASQVQIRQIVTAPKRRKGIIRYMLKEIFEQPQIMRTHCVAALIRMPRWPLRRPEYEHRRAAISGPVVIAACGTSWHAGLV
jgi:glucosamine 6-phosphate synthetase-like amidotransferase/phosphosugar isomerase protein